MEWIKLKPIGLLPPKRGGHTSCIIKNKLYVFGGGSYQPNQTSSLALEPNNLQVYDFTTNIWSILSTNGTPPSIRYGHSATEVGDKIFIIGGYGQMFYDDVHIFDTITNTWSSPICQGQRPSPRYAHSATLVGGTNIFVFAGCYENKCFNELYCLDTLTLTWSFVNTSGSPPQQRSYHTTNLIGRKLYVFGGHVGSTYHSDLYVFNLDSKVWTQGITQGKFETGIAYHSSAIINNQLFIFGGNDGRTCLDTLWKLNIENMEWERIFFKDSSARPPSRHKHTLSVSQDLSLILYGGMEFYPNCFDDLYKLQIPCKNLQSPNLISIYQHPIVLNNSNNSINNNNNNNNNCNINQNQNQNQNQNINNNNNNNSNNININNQQQQQQQQQPNLYSSNNGLVVQIPSSPSLSSLSQSSSSTPSISDLMDDKVKLQYEYNKMKEEYDQIKQIIETVSCLNLSNMSYNELDNLENSFLDGLRKVSNSKRILMENRIKEYSQIKEENDLLKQHFNQIQPLTPLSPTSPPALGFPNQLPPYVNINQSYNNNNNNNNNSNNNNNNGNQKSFGNNSGGGSFKHNSNSSNYHSSRNLPLRRVNSTDSVIVDGRAKDFNNNLSPQGSPHLNSNQRTYNRNINNFNLNSPLNNNGIVNNNSINNNKFITKSNNNFNFQSYQQQQQQQQQNNNNNNNNI